jgi:hypothetical protein
VTAWREFVLARAARRCDHLASCHWINSLIAPRWSSARNYGTWATGRFCHANVPRIAGRERHGGPAIHSSQDRSKDPVRGQRLIVVGAGKSAVQIACELASVARVSLAVRRPVRFGPQRVLGRDIHFWLRWTGLDRNAAAAIPPARCPPATAAPSAACDRSHMKLRWN